VLIQATTFYNKGITVGLFLPFLLGIGMGLPWPFAGAGLSFLPKPGIWMTRVKYGFGVLIVLFAVYYGSLSVGLFRSALALARAGAVGTGSPTGQSPSRDDLLRVLTQARNEGKPVFIDFWASWCKNCSAMEHTTFKAPEVKRRLGTYLQVRFQAEHPNEPGIKEVLDYFGAFGLPTYVILKPKGLAPIEVQATKVVSVNSSAVMVDAQNIVPQVK
jgi:thiol:disulfide interchange protein